MNRECLGMQKKKKNPTKKGSNMQQRRKGMIIYGGAGEFGSSLLW